MAKVMLMTEENIVVLNSQGFVLGETNKVFNGYVFVPNMTSRRSSNKSWPTPRAAIPSWIKKRKCTILTKSEHQALEK